MLVELGVEVFEAASHEVVEDARLASELLAKQQAPSVGQRDAARLAGRTRLDALGLGARRNRGLRPGRLHRPAVADERLEGLRLGPRFDVGAGPFRQL
ncbi:MAG: hypothetical protein RMK20_15775, partial [Verrucomicrobiales bacterium]|nr:hypothetical protein [Verrucomicrobiales bacterium]